MTIEGITIECIISLLPNITDLNSNIYRICHGNNYCVTALLYCYVLTVVTDISNFVYLSLHLSL